MSASGNGIGNPAIRSLDYVVVDVETTGGSVRRGDRITEIAAVRLDASGSVRDAFSSLVNPERSIPPRIASLTGITDSMVADAPRFGAVASRVRRILADGVFVAHNVPFDWRFVGAELERATGSPLEVARRLCTLRLARRVVPELRRRSLDVLTDFFEVRNDARHRAYGDAQATAVILLRLLDRAEARGVQRWDDLEDVLRGQRPKRTS